MDTNGEDVVSSAKGVLRCLSWRLYNEEEEGVPSMKRMSYLLVRHLAASTWGKLSNIFADGHVVDVVVWHEVPRQRGTGA